MCGILGAYNSNLTSVSANKFQLALQTLSQRGPDALGHWADNRQSVWLGHTRLAVLDLSACSNQPMLSNCGKLAIVFNGEIYNWREIRLSLERRGEQFYTNSDTEVLLRLYQLDGPKCLQQLRGMFAFGIYNTITGELFCARDPIGKKPFLYSTNEGMFIFASELPAILKLLNNPPCLNHAGLAQYLIPGLRQLPEPQTAYKDIWRLPPGYCLTVQQGKLIKLERYWRPWQEQKLSSATAFKKNIFESVSLRTRADVEVASLLSGGIDSSLVTALAQANSTKALKTFALGLNSKDPDLIFGQRFAEKLGCTHQSLIFSEKDSLDDYEHLLRVFGEPFALLPLVFTYQLSRQIRDHGIKVALTGNGADELLHGYDGQFQRIWLSRFLEAASGSPANLLSRLVALRPDYAWLLEAPGYRKAALYQQRAALSWPVILSAAALDSREMYDQLHQTTRLYTEIATALPTSNLCDELNATALILDNQISLSTSADLAGMAAGVELRSPFMDQKLYEYIFALPLEERAPVFCCAESTRKYLIKQNFSDLLPDWIRNRPKRGFGYEISEAELLLGPWRSRVDDSFSEASSLDGLIELKKLQQIWADFKQQPNATDAQLIAKLFGLQLWAQAI